MADIEYLYSYGRRRHIRRPGGQTGAQGRSAEAYCGDFFETESRYLDGLNWWDPGLAPQRMARKRTEPICQRCQTAADKAKAVV